MHYSTISMYRYIHDHLGIYNTLTKWTTEVKKTILIIKAIIAEDK